MHTQQRQCNSWISVRFRTLFERMFQEIDSLEFSIDCNLQMCIYTCAVSVCGGSFKVKTIKIPNKNAWKRRSVEKSGKNANAQQQHSEMCSKYSYAIDNKYKLLKFWTSRQVLSTKWGRKEHNERMGERGGAREHKGKTQEQKLDQRIE